jgi:hypothetical protein
VLCVGLSSEFPEKIRPSERSNALSLRSELKVKGLGAMVDDLMVSNKGLLSV